MYLLCRVTAFSKESYIVECGGDGESTLKQAFRKIRQPVDSRRGR